MPIVSVILALALWVPPAVPQDGLVDAGVERNRHVLISSGGVPDRPTAPFLATLFAVPLNWPANSSTYEVWIAEFDCTARSRTMKFRTVFSGRRDPVRTEVEHAPVERGGRAVEAQLDLLCDSGETARTARRSYNNVGEFTRRLRE
jgi:hypothetical protein